jgi:hypothetical protein
MVLAGETYFAQFIDHDITFDVTPLDAAHPYAERIPNFRSPFLNLDQLYGGGPSISPFLYRHGRKPGEEEFLIGKTIKPNGDEGTENDLPRNPKGIALVGDPRQDENLIIAQVHVTFLKFHNLIMKGLKSGDLRSAGPAGATLFDQARRLLTWYYQQSAVNLIADLVDKHVFRRSRVRWAGKGTCGNPSFRIPIEFSAAAFRFGHSIVRDSYNYNRAHKDEHAATLTQLLRQTGMGGGIQPSLPEEWVIELHRFFYLGSPALNNARKFSTKIASALYQLHPSTVKIFNAPINKEESPSRISCNPDLEDVDMILPVRNLWRGARMGLPSGQDIAKALKIKDPLISRDIAGGDNGAVLEEHGFDEDTPLWYYILKEAEILGTGRRLGPVGSWIVTETIFGALHSDPNSYLSIDPSWQKPSNLLPPDIDILAHISSSDQSQIIL